MTYDLKCIFNEVLVFSTLEMFLLVARFIKHIRISGCVNYFLNLTNDAGVSVIILSWIESRY